MKNNGMPELTFNGSPVSLIGTQVKVGDKARNFTALKNDLSQFHLSETKGKIRVLNVVLSLDTSLCDTQTRRFNEALSKWKDQITVITISMDLPFTQARWCGGSGLPQVITVSDHRDALFGVAYGVLIKELRMLARAIFVVDPADIVRYVEYVKEVGTPPDYEKALVAIQSLL